MKGDITKRMVAETIGTFAIVFFGCGAIVTLQGTDAHVAVNIVFGAVVAAMVYALGHVSKAHFNPAVTIAFASAGCFPARECGRYIVAQLVGAVLASYCHALAFGARAYSASFGATAPSVPLGSAFFLEAACTFFLMFVIVAVATEKSVHRAVPGLAIGSVIAFSGLFIGPATGNSLNPARSLGPALFAHQSVSSVWVYLVAPVVGALFGAFVYNRIRSTPCCPSTEATP
ncbi:MAG: aquaporin [Fimbriimonadaceae bacterium]|nr:aquaporin [Fimbriimonadaceae bacterium]QOJ12996.1 MAG: aquaporin [Chthonomonadaceae bacterium]